MPENYRLGAIIGSALFVFPVLAFGIWAFMHWRKNCESLRVLLIVLIPVLMPSLLFGYVNLHNANFAASKGTRQVTALCVNVEPTVQSDDYASVRDFTAGNVMLVTIQSSCNAHWMTSIIGRYFPEKHIDSHIPRQQKS